MRGNDMWARGLVNGLTVEASNGVSVMEPLTATAELTTTGGKQLLAVALSPVGKSCCLYGFLSTRTGDLVSCTRRTDCPPHICLTESGAAWYLESLYSNHFTIRMWKSLLRQSACYQ